MKKIFNWPIILILLFSAACSIDDQVAIDDQIKQSPSSIEKKGSGVNAASVVGGTSMNYYFKGATNNLIHRSNTNASNCSTYSESIATLGNGATSPFGPAVVTFGGKLYLFHKGNTNNRIYYTTSTNGTTWSAAAFLGNASTYTGVSAAVVNGIMYVTCTGATTNTRYNIYLMKSSDGTSWTTTFTGLTINSNPQSNPSTPWIIGSTGSSGNLLLSYTALVGDDIRIRISQSSDQGTSWSLFSNGAAVEYSTFNDFNFQGHSIAYGTNGLCAVYANEVGHTLKISLINSFGDWSSPQIVTSTGGSPASTNRRPVVAWDPICSIYFCVFKANTNNSIYKAYGSTPFSFYEMGTLQGTTGDNPYVIF